MKSKENAEPINDEERNVMIDINQLDDDQNDNDWFMSLCHLLFQDTLYATREIIKA